MLRAAERLAPLIDPNLHSCGTVRPHGEAELRQPEKDFYIVGMKSYGRAPTFLLATGYEQARSVVAALAGDWQAARDVRLNLPETGVCVTDYQDDAPCCDPIAVDCCTPCAHCAWRHCGCICHSSNPGPNHQGQITFGAQSLDCGLVQRRNAQAHRGCGTDRLLAAVARH